jgi:hypothetical protein
MTYEKLIETVSLILENNNIYKNGLILTYALTPKNHKAMNEILFYKSNPPSANPILTDEFEVEIEGIIVKFVKKQEQ